MTVDQIIEEAKKLDRAEQYRVIQNLLKMLAEEDRLLQEIVPGAEYEIWSPYDSEDAALTMMQVLAAYKEEEEEEIDP